jgi:hypothetical protein
LPQSDPAVVDQASFACRLFHIGQWEIKTNCGHLKTTMKMDVLKYKTLAGALKELHVFKLITSSSVK